MILLGRVTGEEQNDAKKQDLLELYQTSTGKPVDQILGAYHFRPDRFNQEPFKQ